MAVHPSIDYVKSFRNGDNAGFDYFFNALYKPAYFVALQYMKDHPTVEEIISTSFIKLWNKRNIFVSEKDIKAYLYRIVINACLRHLQQKQKLTAHNKKYLLQVDTTEQPCVHKIVKAETIHLLHVAISQLPTQCKTVFTKLYIDEKSVVETAREMNLTVSTIKNQKARGIELLRTKIMSL